MAKKPAHQHMFGLACVLRPWDMTTRFLWECKKVGKGVGARGGDGSGNGAPEGWTDEGGAESSEGGGGGGNGATKGGATGGVC